MTDLVRVPVELGPRSYEVVIGPDAARTVCVEAAGLPRVGKIAVLADSGIGALFRERIERDLAATGVPVVSHLLPEGERAKSLATVETVCRQLVRDEIERDDLLVGLGGGAATDVAGFVGAVFLRGVRLVLLPTTLLGQVDASLGGKTGVNLPEGKNLVGAFCQPRLVGCDPQFLATLPEREFRSGLAEVVKTAWLGDPEVLTMLEAEPPGRTDALSLSEIVRRCVAVKAGIVARDERERGIRSALNFGHTFGHAIETAAQGRWLHGEAVALGLVAAVQASVTMRRCAQTDLERLLSLLTRLGLPVTDPELDIVAVLAQTRRDKKRRRGRDRYQLTEGVGSVSVTSDLSEEAARAALEFLRR